MCSFFYHQFNELSSVFFNLIISEFVLQDTVVALEALTKYIASLPVINKTDLVVVMNGNQLTKTFQLSEDNKLVQQKLTTSNLPTKVTATVTGEGCALVQVCIEF